MALENDLGRDPIRSLVLRIAIPSMLAQFVSVLYSIVDRIYIGNIPEIGEIALAGVGVCGPVVTMVGSVASLICLGRSPLIGMSLGQGNEERAKRILANCLLMLLAAAAVLTAVILSLRRPMLYLFGASDVTYPYADAYFTVYISGTVFALLSTGLSQLILAQGFAKVSMCLVLLGAVLNIVLDPIFMFALGMGVPGAALATVLSQMGSAAYGLLFLAGKRTRLRLSFGGYRLSLMGHILAIGFSPFLIIAVDNIMIIAMNAVLQRYGGPEQGDMLVTVSTIVQSFMLVVTMPLGGISGGTQSILSFNFGAGNRERVLKAQREIVKLCVAYTALLFLLARVAGPLFVALFNGDGEVADLSQWAIRVCTAAIIPLGVQYEIVDGFTAMGQVRILPVLLPQAGVFLGALPHPGVPGGSVRLLGGGDLRHRGPGGQRGGVFSFHQQGPGPGPPGPVGRGIGRRPALTNAAVYETIPHIRKTRTRLWNRSTVRTTRRSSLWSSM